MAEKTKAKQLVLKVPQEAFYATGRRKEAIAKVWLFPGKGTISVNNQELKEYIKRSILVDSVNMPLNVLSVQGKYDVKVSTLGGGLTGQAEAIQLGIARALVSMDENFRKPLRANGLLTRNARVKERKKYGRQGARKKPTYRKR